MLGFGADQQGQGHSPWNTNNNGDEVALWRTVLLGQSQARPALGKRGSLQKLALIEIASKPVWRYRCPRWPPSKGLLESESRLQNKIVAVAQRLRPGEGETPAAYMIRRNRAAAIFSRRQGSWTLEHIRLCSSWCSHLLRPANANFFASALVRHKDAAWLQSRRYNIRPKSAPRGTGTRCTRGFIVPRWEEALLHRLAGF